MRASVLDSVARPVMVDRAVYGTIAIACVLIIYDGWAKLSIVDAVVIVVGPILAMFTSHVFSAILARHIALGRGPTGPEWSRTVAFEARFLLLAVPPVVLLVVLDAAGLAIVEIIRVVVWFEGLSIGFWAGLAARRAGLAAEAVALAALAGLLVGAIVLAFQVLLQPGKVDQGELGAPARPMLILRSAAEGESLGATRSNRAVGEASRTQIVWV